MYRSIRLPLVAIITVCTFMVGFTTGTLTGYFLRAWQVVAKQTTVVAGTKTPISMPTPTPTPSIDQVRQDILRLVNAQRRQHGLPALIENSYLNQSAELKAKDMVAKSYWSHYAPDGTNPWDFFDQVGYRYTLAGENLAEDFATADGVVTGWLQSPTHRENILGAGYTETGIAVVYNYTRPTNGGLSSSAGKTTMLVVEHFARPMPH